jgi:hypothetical protein
VLSFSIERRSAMGGFDAELQLTMLVLLTGRERSETGRICGAPENGKFLIDTGDS